MLIQDIRYAVRSLLKDGAVTATVLLCLGLGVGINATLFSVVDGVLIQPLPFEDPDRLVVLNETFVRTGGTLSGVSYPMLQDWRTRLTTFSAVAGLVGRSMAVSDASAETERFAGAAISSNLFSTLGVPPALGRPFGPADDRPGAEPVAILSDAVWQRRYQGDPSIIGRRITINTQPHTIVGVMPPRFAFPNNEKIWIPLAPIAEGEPRSARTLTAYGRLKPNVSLAAAQTELTGLAASVAADYPLTNEGWSAAPRAIVEAYIPSQVRLVLLTMMGAVTLVLLIACANVANLMLSRATARTREFSVRAAIGASRWRMVRQLLTECIILGLAAAPLGLVVAAAGVALLRAAVPIDSVPYSVHWELNARAIVYTTLIAALTGIAFGLAPAIQAGRLNIVDALRDGSRGAGTSGRRAKLRNAFVVVQIALALVLLVGASLFIRSFVNLQAADTGFDAAPILTMRFYMTGDTYDGDQPKVSRVDDIVRRVEALPGVEAAFASNYIPLESGGGGGSIEVDGRTAARGEEPVIRLIAVTPHFHKTIGVPLTRGRSFTDAEGMTRAPVAVIDEVMAKRLWPDEDPVGRRFRLTEKSADTLQLQSEWFTIIGVAPAIRRPDLDDRRPPIASAFVPYPYMATPNTGLTIRAANPGASTAAVREAIRASDPGLAVFNVRLMDDVRMLIYWQYQLFGVMFGVFGGVALFLAAIGVYGVLSFSVSQRTQEIGLRMALGAERQRVLRLVVRQGIVLAVVGVVFGVIGAFGITRVIRTLLFRVTPTDPVSFIAVSLFLTVVAALASYFPARRATTVDPVVALRSE